MLRNKEVLKNTIIAIIIIAFFIITSYLAKEYSNQVEQIIGLKGFIGIILYTIITVIAVVFAPVSTLPFIAIASVLWGGFISAILSVIGWVIGSAIAFGLARRYGRPLISKFINIKKIEHFENIIPPKNQFWMIVFLRLVLPVDLLSYALGIFTKVPFSIFMYATVIGLIPFAFIFAYAVNLQTSYQIIAGSLGLIMFLVGVRYILKNPYQK